MVNAFRDFGDVPLVMSIEDAARVLNTSTRTLRRRLAAGQHVPGVMPRQGQEPWQFSKHILQRHVEGGYASMRVVRKRA